jgi:membrane protease YdiL (CAAX protease family)
VGSRYSHAPSWFSPLLAAVIVTGIIGGRPALADLWARMTRWRVPARWYVVCLGVPLVMFALAATIGGWPSWADLGKFNGLPAWGVLGVWALEIGWNGLGEETGWRGFALPMLQDRHGPLLGTLLLRPSAGPVGTRRTSSCWRVIKTSAPAPWSGSLSA